MSPEEPFELHLLSGLVGVLSFFASAFVLFMYPTYSPFQESALSRLCVVIALADIVAIFAQLIGAVFRSPTMFCQVQAILQVFGSLTTAFLIVAVCLDLILAMTFEVPSDFLRTLDLVWCVIATTSALVLSIIPMILAGASVYGDAILWCWFKNEKYSYWWFYLPVLSCLLVSVITATIVRIILFVKSRRDIMSAGISDSDSAVNVLPAAVYLYMFTMLLTWAPLLVLIYSQQSNSASVGAPTGTSDSLSKLNQRFFLYAEAVLMPLRGVADSLVAFYLAWRGRSWQRKMRQVGLYGLGLASTSSAPQPNQWWEDFDARMLRRVSTAWKSNSF